MGVPSDGSYGIPEGVLYGYPVTCKGGQIQIVKGLDVSDFSRKRMDATLKELHEERDGVKHLLGGCPPARHSARRCRTRSPCR
jgi:malate dehydrogenase